MTQRTLLLIIVTLLLSLLPASPMQAQSPDPHFGVVQTYDDNEAAAELGVGFTRVKLYWDIIQPNGAQDWQPANIPDPLLAQDLAAGRQIVGLIIRTPAWARDPHHPANDPTNPSAEDVPDMAAWGQFVGKLAAHYAGRIDHWIIWNEPDVWDTNHPGSTWKGSVADFATLHKTAYINIKQANPNAQVYLTGVTYFWDYEAKQEQYLSRLLPLLTATSVDAAHQFYLDGLMLHLYYKPQMIYDILAEIHTMMALHGLADKPVWLNETNAAPTQDPQEPPHFQDLPFEVTLTEQAAFMIQLHALTFAAGVERVQLYKLYNSPDFPEDARPFGLVRGDSSRRPAFAAYQVVTTYLRDFQQVQAWRQGEVSVVLFDRGETQVTVLWNWATEPRQVSLQAHAETAQWVDEQGNQQTATAHEGSYQLELPPAECSGGDCFIGGAPRLLVEKRTAYGSPRFTVSPLETPPTAPPPTMLEQARSTKRRMAAFGFALLTGLGLVVVGGLNLWR